MFVRERAALTLQLQDSDDGVGSDRVEDGVGSDRDEVGVGSDGDGDGHSGDGDGIESASIYTVKKSIPCIKFSKFGIGLCGVHTVIISRHLR